MPNTAQLFEKMTAWSWTHMPNIAVTIVVALIAAKLASAIVNRLFRRLTREGDGEAQKRLQTLQSLARHFTGTTVLIVAVIILLSEIGINVGPVLAAAGVVGVAVGFGSQQLVQDVISGFFILMEDQIRVGDVIDTAGHAGVVESVTLRTTRLRDLAGDVHYIRNGRIDVVTNKTKEFSFYVFDVGVAYRESTDEVVEIMKQVDEGLRADEDFKSDILEPIEILGLDSFGDSALMIKARVKTRPITQWRVGREFNRRLKIAFDEHDIEIPFPHTTLYMGRDKRGSAPPLPVVLQGGGGG